MALNPELTLQDYWRIIRRRKILLLSTWASVVAATFLFSEWQTPVYQAQAVVKLDPPVTISGMNPMDFDSWSLLSTEVKSIRSTSVAQRAARLLGWVTDETSEEQGLRIANALQDQIQSDKIGDSKLLRVAIASDDPQKAADIANAVVKAYIEKGIADRNQKTREMKEFTGQELQKSEKKLRTAEDILRVHTERSGSRGLGQYLTSELISLQTRLDGLLKDYTEQHPDVKAARARMTAVQAQIRQLPREDTEFLRLAREVGLAEEEYKLLKRKYTEAQIAESGREQIAFIDSPALVPTRPVRPNKRVNMMVGMVVGFLLGLMAVLVAENLDTSAATIEEVERYLELPVLAVVPHIDLPGDGGKNFITRHLAPAPPMEDIRRRLVIFHPPQSSFGEAYHTLRTNLRFNIRPGRRPAPVVGFTSAGISEGKTLTGTNFALVAAQSGLKTLFIEADLRRPSAHKLLGMKREPGLTDALANDRPWQELVRGTSDLLLGELRPENLLKMPGVENFRFLACGPSPINPADVFESARFEQILREVRTAYDLVVIDCAPVMLFADALLLGPRTDGLVLVYKAGRTARGALKRAKDQLQNVRTNLLGVVLNDLRAAEMEPQYGYYYYSYSYKEDPGDKKIGGAPRA